MALQGVKVALRVFAMALQRVEMALKISAIPLQGAGAALGKPPAGEPARLPGAGDGGKRGRCAVVHGRAIPSHFSQITLVPFGHLGFLRSDFARMVTEWKGAARKFQEFFFRRAARFSIGAGEAEKPLQAIPFRASGG